jgi:hypothetical protein
LIPAKAEFQAIQGDAIGSVEGDNCGWDLNAFLLTTRTFPLSRGQAESGISPEASHLNVLCPTMFPILLILELRELLPW